MVAHLCKVRDAQYRCITALRAEAALCTPLPDFFSAMHPRNQYTSTSKLQTKYRRVRRLPNELMTVVVDLMVDRMPIPWP